MTDRNLNTHSDGHVCSKCGGKGYISKTETNEQGYIYEYLRVCDCQREQQKPMLKASANIPYEYRNCSINDFNIAVYTNKEMPLRYNNDKRKKPLFSRGSRVCRHLFNSFSKLKSDEKNIKKRRLFH